MRDSDPVSGRVAPIKISLAEGAAAAGEPPEAGCCCWSVDCLHATTASAQRTGARVMVRMARHQNHFFLQCSSGPPAQRQVNDLPRDTIPWCPPRKMLPVTRLG